MTQHQLSMTLTAEQVETAIQYYYGKEVLNGSVQIYSRSWFVCEQHVNPSQVKFLFKAALDTANRKPSRQSLPLSHLSSSESFSDYDDLDEEESDRPRRVNTKPNGNGK